MIIYNTLTRKKEPFRPLVPGQIGLYVCGNTVYDDCHLGHARSMVAFDVIVRYLRSRGYQVRFVRNITDIDDKIITRAAERGVSISELTETYIRAMTVDNQALGNLPPDEEPRATAYIAEIIALIERLLAADMAYVSDNGDVCFEVERFADYGKLSNKDLDGLLAGARIDVVQEKKSPLDFVLWKKAKPGEPSWASPWGDGRPGWHIECSAMSMGQLGETFDIHGGGLDLQFPHHENEIAQSEGATGKPFANYWMHVGMLQVNGEKMSKSLGNFFTIQDVLAKHHPEAVRYLLLSSHYRSPLNYTEDNLTNAKKALARLYQSLRDYPLTAAASLDQAWVDRFNQAMDDDFNTPEALAVLFDLSHQLNKQTNPDMAHTLRHLAGLLGLLQADASDFLQAGEAVDKNRIEQLISERLAARQTKDWARADEIRQELAAQGIELEDGPEGTLWRIKI